jgi:hypothetical protein
MTIIEQDRCSRWLLPGGKTIPVGAFLTNIDVVTFRCTAFESEQHRSSAGGRGSRGASDARCGSHHDDRLGVFQRVRNGRTSMFAPSGTGVKNAEIAAMGANIAVGRFRYRLSGFDEHRCSRLARPGGREGAIGAHGANSDIDMFCNTPFDFDHIGYFLCHGQRNCMPFLKSLNKLMI